MVGVGVGLQPDAVHRRTYTPRVASGFIVLRDGRCLAVRSRLHDSVVRSIARAIPIGDPLREWLTKQAPGHQDAELGHAFVRTGDAVHVSRLIDTRGMTPETRLR